jgi:hypothetical protein
LGVLAEAFPTLLASESHLEALEKGVLLLFRMAFGAVEPFLACGW